MNHTKVLLLAVVLSITSIACSARDYLSYEFLGGNRTNSCSEPTLDEISDMVALPDGSTVFADRSQSCLFVLKDGQMRVLAGRPNVRGTNLGSGDVATFSDIRQLMVDLKSGDILVLDSDARRIDRVSLEGDVRVEQGVEYEKGHAIAFDRLPDGTLYVLGDEGRVYRSSGGASAYIDIQLHLQDFIRSGIFVTGDGKLICHERGYESGSFQPVATTRAFMPDWTTHTAELLDETPYQLDNDPDGPWYVATHTRAANGEIYVLLARGYNVIALARVEGLSIAENVTGIVSDTGISTFFSPCFAVSMTGVQLAATPLLQMYSVDSTGFHPTDILQPEEGHDIGAGLRALSFDASGRLTYLTMLRSISTWSEEGGFVARRAPSYDWDSRDLIPGRRDFPASKLSSAISDISGNIYVTDQNGNALLKWNVGGSEEVIAGVPYGPGNADGPSASARFQHISSFGFLPDGTIALLDSGNLRMISPTGMVSTVLSRASVPEVRDEFSEMDLFALSVSRSGRLYLASRYTLFAFDAVNGLVPLAGPFSNCNFNGLFSISAAADGTVFLGDRGRILRWSADGGITDLGGVPVGYVDSNASKRLGEPSLEEPYVIAAGEPDTLYIGGNMLLRAVVKTHDNDPIRIVNFSARGAAFDQGQPLVVGYNVSGPGAVLLCRAVGPSLKSFGVTDALASTGVATLEADGLTSAQLKLEDIDGVIVKDPLLSLVGRRAGAFELSGTGREGAVIAKVARGNGFVTLWEPDPSGGTALLELYDLKRLPNTELTNCSIRGRTGGPSGRLAGGFVLEGLGRTRILARVAGPALKQFGVSAPIAHPHLRVFSAGAQITEAAGRDGPSGVDEAAANSGAFAFEPGSADAAVLLDLAPGAYTVEADFDDAEGGTALVEIYVVR